MYYHNVNINKEEYWREDEMSNTRHKRRPTVPTCVSHRDSYSMHRGFLQPSILLLLAEEPSHGYGLLERLVEMGVIEKRLPLPVIYRVLRRLERDKLAVSGHAESEGRGPSRKVYRLTDDGWDALYWWSENLKGVRELLDEFQKRYESLERKK